MERYEKIQQFHKTVVDVTNEDIICSVRLDKQRCALANAFDKVFGTTFHKINVGPVSATFYDDDHRYFFSLSYAIRDWIRKYDVSKGLVNPISVRLQRRKNNIGCYNYYFEMA